MVDPGEDFEEFHEEEPQRPLLPPDDRLWRHPSEMGALDSPEAAAQTAARRRWLAKTPTRAGAGAAGIVGALLAAGVVLLGTHLTTWISPGAKQRDALARSVLAGGVTTTLASAGPSLRSGVGPIVTRISKSLVRVVGARSGSRSVRADGVIISSGGFVLAPASAVVGTESVSIILSDGEQLIAQVTGVDTGTGLAVLRVDGSDLPYLQLSEQHPVPKNSFVIVAWREASFVPAISRLAGWRGYASLAGGPALLYRCPRSLGLAAAPDGALVVGGDGNVAGIVVAHHAGRAVAAPGWLAARVTHQLVAKGYVVHGWLGISGKTTHLDPSGRAQPSAKGTTAGAPERSRSGVEVVRVLPGSAAKQVGIAPGDVIEAVDGHAVTSMSRLQAMLYLMSPGAKVTLALDNGKRVSEVSARLRAAA